MRMRRGLLGLALVLTLIFAWTPHPPTLIPNDKAQHVVAFVVLTILAAVAYPRVHLRWTVLWLAVFGAVIELVQGLSFIHRDCDIYDWFADSEAILGAVVMIGPIRWLIDRLNTQGHDSVTGDVH